MLPIRTTAELRDFRRQERPELRVLDVSGQVISCDKTQLILEDETGRAEIICSEPGITPGQLVQIQGLARMNNSLRPWDYPEKVSVLGEKPVPPPVFIRLEEIDAVRDDLRILQTEGTVLSVVDDEIDLRFKILLLKDATETLLVFYKLTSGNGKVEELVGARIHVTGQFFRHINGCRYYSQPSLVGNRISVITPPNTDPFDVPELKGRSDQTIREIARMDKRKVSGRVLATWDGNRVMIQGPARKKFFARLKKGTALPSPDDTITILGLPDADAFNITLEDAIWKPSTQFPDSAAEKPSDITPQKILHTDTAERFNPETSYQGSLIRLRGTLIALPAPEIGNNHLILDCDGYNLPVEVSLPSECISRLIVGSQLRVTGRCLLESTKRTSYDIFPQITSLSVITRSPGDIEVLSTPPWWTPARLLGVIAALLAALVGIATWNRSLKRLVQKRGEELSRAEVAKVSSELRVGERTRLAVELHDGLSQNLTGVGMKIKAAQNCGKDDPEAMLRHLAIADRALQSCRNELRNSLWDLRNESLEDEDLNHAIERTLLPHVENVELSVRVNIPRERLTDSTAHAFLKIIRELALNAIRHGHATAVKVAGALEDGRLYFSVRDNGAGFDPDVCPGVTAGHFGIQGIRERLDRFNGQLVYERLPAGGMRATVSMNIPTQENLP